MSASIHFMKNMKILFEALRKIKYQENFSIESKDSASLACKRQTGQYISPISKLHYKVS